MADYPLYSGNTVAQVETKVRPLMIISSSGTDVVTGVRIYPSNMTTAQILTNLSVILPVTSSGNTLF